MLQRRIELCGDAPRAPLQPCKRRVRPPTGGPPAQGRSTPEQAQSEKSQGGRGTESPDPSITDQRNRELRVRFFGGTTHIARHIDVSLPLWPPFPLEAWRCTGLLICGVRREVVVPFVAARRVLTST